MTYPLDPELAAVVELMPPFTLDDIGAARAMFAAVMAEVPVAPEAQSLEITDRLIPGPADGPQVRVRVYRPTDEPGPLPAVLYLHSGGWVFGSIEAEHAHVAAAACAVGAVMVSVNYRQAPEHPYPAAVEDGYAALEWLAGSAAGLGAMPDRLAVMGTSAGGGLAAALALMSRDRGGPRIAFQSLSAPVLDDRLVTASMLAYHDTPVWNRPNAVLSWQHYLAGWSGEVPAYAAPARAEDLSGLPPTYLAVSQFDPLRDEGMEFAARLLRAGIPTELHCHPGTFHATVLTPFSAIARRQVEELHQTLRQALRG